MPERVTPGGEPITELALAEAFVTQHHAELRHVRLWRAWLHYAETHWQRDATGAVERLFKDLLRGKITAATTLEDDKARRTAVNQLLGCCTARQVQAVLTLASTEPEVAVLPEVFDADPWALNLRNGTLDLRTGELHAHRREALITKCAPTTHDAAAACPRWEQFLQEIMGHNDAMVAFLSRAVGYTLTGTTTEQVLFFCHGSGQNGKSVFLETLADVLGPDSAVAAAFATFLEQRRDGNAPSPDVARLRGARLVSASEAPGGRSFDAVVLKELVGGDTMTARFLRENPFQFKPQFKLWLRANHKPPVHEQTVAFWRRMKVIPFSVTIPEPQRDHELHAKLLAEAPGILNWAVRGCLAWQRDGLGEPPDVRAATEAYRAENDTIAEFLDAYCALEPHAWTATSELYRAFTTWWERTHAKHEKPLTRAWFARLLGERDGLRPEASGHAKTRGWRGVRLLDTPLALALTEEAADDLPY